MMGLGVKEVSEVIATLEVIDDTLAGEIKSKTNVANSDNFDNFDNSKKTPITSITSVTPITSKKKIPLFIN